MAADRLQQAIALIRAGRKREAQALLEALIKSDPRQLKAWLWYAEACDGPEAKMRVLETCKRMNPGNPLVDQAIAALRRATGPLIKPTQPLQPAPPPASPFREEPEQAPAFVSPFAEESTPADPKSEWESYTWEPPAEQQESEPAYSFEIPTAAEERPKPEKWEYKPPETTIEVEPPGESYAFFDVWFMALFGGLKDFKAILNDPRASFMRAIGWYGSVLLVNSLIGIAMQFLLIRQIPELNALLRQMPSSYRYETAIIGTAFAQFFWGMLQFVIFGSIQHFIAAAFKGRGDFKSTVYALSAFQSPLVLLNGLVSIAFFLVALEPLKAMFSTLLSSNVQDPEALSQQLANQMSGFTALICVALLVGLGVLIYVLIVNVRALKAAHEMGTGTAILVVLASVIVSVLASWVLSCCVQYYVVPLMIPGGTPTGY